MQLLFSDLYCKAVGLFDDPKITVAYDTNPIQFAKIMYSYLQNSISLFNNPVEIATMLSDVTPPQGTMEVFVSDGSTRVYTFDPSFILLDKSLYQFTGDGEYIEAVIDYQERTVTFSKDIEAGKEYSVEQYYPGNFNIPDGWGTTPASQGALGYTQDILARLMVKAWGENLRNFLLDIQNLLNDTDFKTYANSTSLRAKDAWIDQLDTEILQYQNKLAWNLRILKQKHKKG